MFNNCSGGDPTDPNDISTSYKYNSQVDHVVEYSRSRLSERQLYEQSII